MGYPNWQKRRKNKNTEGALQLQILKYLRAIGAVAGKTKTMGVRRGKVYCYDPYTMRGKGDLEAFKDMIMYAIEVKAPGNAIEKGSDQDYYRSLFHAPPSRIFIEADCLEDVMEIIK